MCEKRPFHVKECEECPDFDLCLEQVILQIEEIEEIGEDYLRPAPREPRKDKVKIRPRGPKTTQNPHGLN